MTRRLIGSSPEWVKRPLRPLVARLRRFRMGEPGSDAVEQPQQPDRYLQELQRVTAARRDEFRARFEEARRARDEARRQRDTAREHLRAARAERTAARAEVVALRRELARRGSATDVEPTAWWDQRLSLSEGSHGRVFAHFPSGDANPYVALLCSRLDEFGFDVLPVASIERIFRLPDDSVLHLHWTRTAQAGAETEEAARTATARFLEPIEDLVARGGTLLWSIHEPLPHDCRFPDVEIELRRRLAELAHGVHVLHESTIDEVTGLYPLDTGKVFVIEHPLYTGMYPSYLTRASARAQLGIDPDVKLVLCFGSIRPYKGFERVVASMPEVRATSGEDVRVMICGAPAASEDMSHLLAVSRESAWASISPSAVGDRHVQVLFKAADVVALPYRYIHNSGVLMLGLTFGRHCVAPDNAVTRAAASSGLVHLFDAESDDDLRRAILEGLARSGESPELSDDFLDRHDPQRVAAGFAREVERIVRRRGSPSPDGDEQGSEDDRGEHVGDTDLLEVEQPE